MDFSGRQRFLLRFEPLCDIGLGKDSNDMLQKHRLVAQVDHFVLCKHNTEPYTHVFLCVRWYLMYGEGCWLLWFALAVDSRQLSE